MRFFWGSLSNQTVQTLGPGSNCPLHTQGSEIKLFIVVYCCVQVLRNSKSVEMEACSERDTEERGESLKAGGHHTVTSQCQSHWFSQVGEGLLLRELDYWTLLRRA